MKVRCIRILDAVGEPQNKSGWLTIGRIYHVLELFQDSDRWLLRLMGDEPNGLALFRLDEFEMVSSKIPNSWIITWAQGGMLHLRPKCWSTSLLERYYDRDRDAIRIIEEEWKEIIDADP